MNLEDLSRSVSLIERAKQVHLVVFHDRNDMGKTIARLPATQCNYGPRFIVDSDLVDKGCILVVQDRALAEGIIQRNNRPPESGVQIPEEGGKSA